MQLKMFWVLVFAFGICHNAFALETLADSKPTAPVSAESTPPTAPATTPASPPTPKTEEQLPAYFAGKNANPLKPDWPDPTGANTGVTAAPAGDGKGDIPFKINNTGLYDRIAHNLISINFVWALICGFLVMFMQAGFALVETGLCRKKNAGNTMAMNFMIYPLGCLGFWAYGFALGWGNWYNGYVPDGYVNTLGPGLNQLNGGAGLGPAADGSGAFTYGLMGTKGFFLNGMNDVGIMAYFFFMMVFMDTTATIPTGAMAERWSWDNFVLYGLWVALPYCLYANWVWGGGWLAQAGKNWNMGHGAVDFAGSGVVHAMGGIIALAGAKIIGPRIGKYSASGQPQPMPGHNVPYVVLGTFILAFGWFGFNPGSTLAGTDLRISVVVVNTMLASAAGAFSSMLTLKAKGLRPDPTFCCNGMLAGLVAITAPCAFVSSWAAVMIGAVAGFIVVFSVFFWEECGIDDPVGAISVHGVNGIWGVISVGIFANGEYGAGWNGVVREGFVKHFGSDGVRGLLYGDASQFFMQILDAAVVIIFGYCMAWVWFKASNLITPLRVAADVETMGLDIPEMGINGYDDGEPPPQPNQPA